MTNEIGIIFCQLLTDQCDVTHCPNTAINSAQHLLILCLFKSSLGSAKHTKAGMRNWKLFYVALSY